MTKVMVIGNAGGGKSTLGKSLSKGHGLPYFSIDKIQWRPGWVPLRKAEYDQRHAEIISGSKWLLDGYGPWYSVLQRMDAADTIILVDHPIWVHYWWATKRLFTSLLFTSSDAPTGCPLWPVTLRLYKMIWHLHVHQRINLISEAHARAETARIVHIVSPRELTRFSEDSLNDPNT